MARKVTEDKTRAAARKHALVAGGLPSGEASDWQPVPVDYDPQAEPTKARRMSRP